jgi:ribonucleoside-diphosphate reductase alpha chain
MDSDSIIENIEKQQKLRKGLTIPRYFTKDGQDPFDMCEYEKRSSIIRNPDGSLVFEMNDVEVPTNWTQVATDILAQKYLRKAGVPLRNGDNELLLDENGKVITGAETSIKQVAHRIAGCWRHWGETYGYFLTKEDAINFYEEMVFMIINQYAAPNSPQWFTTGLNWAYGLTGPAQGHSYIDPVTEKLELSKDAYSRSAPHACFIQKVSDDLVRDGGIFSLLTREARIFKYGSGTGSNFSNIRGKGEGLSGGGSSSGLMSFLKIFDVAAGSIKSGGTTRRAAKMVCLDLNHPEIEDFIWWKVREEEKVAGLVAGSKILKTKLAKLIELSKNKESPMQDAQVKQAVKDAAQSQIPVNYIVRAMDLAKQGYDLPLAEFDTHYESEAYITVSGQNSNNSIRIPNTFFEALDSKGPWHLKGRIDGKTFKTISSEKLWDDIGYCAWASADPGVQYDTTMNEWHTCPEGGRINASNPCSEYLFLDDTACNLASINLVKYYDEDHAVFDIKAYRHAVRLWTVALEISVLMAHFPSEPIAQKSYEYRTLGLGFANIGSLLMLQSIPYDSDEARAISGAMAAILTGDSYATSAQMAQVLGPFKNYHKNKDHMLKIIRNHRRAAYNEKDYEGLSVNPIALNQQICPDALLNAAKDSWDKALELGEQHGYRNAQTTVIAPTGTIGLVMDCDTTGVEPDYALVKFKKLAGGGFFKIVNNSVPSALKKLGYSQQQINDIINYCLGRGTLNNSPHVNRTSLKEKGLTNEILDTIEAQLKNSMDIRHQFNQWTIGEEFYNANINGASNILESMGYTKAQILEANEFICGTMTLEGAPHLQPEHYSVFDCANKCGAKGTRYIHPYGHLKMLAAVQPFISGAISKTVNMPQDWTVKQIKAVYYDAWKMMIKAVALYRDGCKLSQPLNSTLEDSPELKETLESISEPSAAKEILRKKIKIGPQKLTLSVHVEKGSIGKISLDYQALTPVQQSMMEALLNMINMGIQNGISPLQMAKQSLQVEGHPLLKELAIFLEECEEDFGPGGSVQSAGQTVTKQSKPNTTITDGNKIEKCGSCGASQLRQNGTCMLCEVCGETTGCS